MTRVPHTEWPSQDMRQRCAAAGIAAGPIIDRIVDAIACRHCRAAGGEPCWTKSGARATATHLARWVDAVTIFEGPTKEGGR